MILLYQAASSVPARLLAELMRSTCPLCLSSAPDFSTARMSSTVLYDKFTPLPLGVNTVIRNSPCRRLSPLEPSVTTSSSRLRHCTRSQGALFGVSNGLLSYCIGYFKLTESTPFTSAFLIFKSLIGGYSV